MRDGSWPPLLPYVSDFREFVKLHATTPLILPDGLPVNVFWLTANADTPAAAAMMGNGGGAAYHAHHSRLYTGIHLGRGGGGMRFLGYSEPQQQHSATRWEVDTDGNIIPSNPAGPTSILLRDAQQATHELLDAAARRVFHLRSKLTDTTFSSARRAQLKRELESIPLVREYSWFIDLEGNPLPDVRLDCSMLLALFHKSPFGIVKNLFELFLPNEKDFPQNPPLTSSLLKGATRWQNWKNASSCLLFVLDRTTTLRSTFTLTRWTN